MASLSFSDYRNIKPGDPGYSPEAAKARKMFSPSRGTSISRRQFDKQAHGGIRFESRPGARKTYLHHDIHYQSALRDYQIMRAEAGKPVASSTATKSKEFRQIMLDLSSDDNSPTGRKAQALVKIGRRRVEHDWPVGETPKEFRSAA